MESVLVLFVIILFGWLVVLTYFLYKNNRSFQRLGKLTGGAHAGMSFSGLIEKMYSYEHNNTVLAQKLELLSQRTRFHLQKVKIVRYNPFADTGGDQSFIMTLLDGAGNGIVVTSLHSRGQTRWYAKNVKEGKGVEHELSKEEQQALKVLI